MKTANDVLEMISLERNEAENRFESFYENTVIPTVMKSGGKKTVFGYDIVHKNIKGANETQSAEIFYEKMVKLGYVIVRDKTVDRTSWYDNRFFNVSIALA